MQAQFHLMLVKLRSIWDLRLLAHLGDVDKRSDFALRLRREVVVVVVVADKISPRLGLVIPHSPQTASKRLSPLMLVLYPEVSFQANTSFARSSGALWERGLVGGSSDRAECRRICHFRDLAFVHCSLPLTSTLFQECFSKISSTSLDRPTIKALIWKLDVQVISTGRNIHARP
ncbi:predicted protein [Sclerotinia sclerotiorum 1980 UF-70]|uniref:Uncharacterized protein n=1 Tax=Sclerotinia sclerotiorum (strain ATCC 18683 / 1980 / Ss-1) TaxID=665079 RepID=A7EVC8_SCLS1|nr:predicted protein [Sclerotinia sclerotiorum 1980 UF-70]EDN93420.1 predicted protein [Sclerotinia sclerotiorum 1980 UF-70]